MKRIIYIAVILMGILPFFGKELQSSCFAQSMSIEDAWDKADETGFYGKYRCPECGQIFEGNDQALLQTELDDHISEEHTNNDDSGSNDDDNDPFFGSTEDSGYNPGYNVINIENAAQVAQKMGIDSKQDFLNYYNWYNYGYVSDKVVLLSDFFNFIWNKYGATPFYDIYTAVNYYDKYFIFYKSQTSGNYHYYGIYQYYSIQDSAPYECIYVFE